MQKCLLHAKKRRKTAQNDVGKNCGCFFKLRTDVVVNVKSLSDENSSTAAAAMKNQAMKNAEERRNMLYSDET